MSDALKALKEKAHAGETGDERYPAWDVAKLDDGAVLAGTLVRGDHVMKRDGQDARIMIIEDAESGDRFTVWCTSVMLRDFVVENAPTPGSLVVLEYHGKFPMQSDPSRKFNKIVAVTDSEPDFPYWDQLREVMVRKDAAYTQAAGSGGAAAGGMTTPSFGPDEAPF